MKFTKKLYKKKKNLQRNYTALLNLAFALQTSLRIMAQPKMTLAEVDSLIERILLTNSQLRSLATAANDRTFNYPEQKVTSNQCQHTYLPIVRTLIYPLS